MTEATATTTKGKIGGARPGAGRPRKTDTFNCRMRGSKELQAKLADMGTSLEGRLHTLLEFGGLDAAKTIGKRWDDIDVADAAELAQLRDDLEAGIASLERSILIRKSMLEQVEAQLALAAGGPFPIDES